MFPIYLASTSPRRKQLLEQIGLPFQLIKPEIEEIMDTDLDAEELVKKMAILKAKSVENKVDSGLIIAADTIVVKGQRILGKPADEKDAYKMLNLLSGKSHYVYSAVVLLEKGTGKMETIVEKTKVTMRKLNEEEIQAYVASGEPLDAAGAYKIQEKGAKFVIRIEGCFYNVVGLPIAKLVEILKSFNVDLC
ncbi:MAG: Maf family protein [Candidatus Helarchaeota archaeon]